MSLAEFIYYVSEHEKKLLLLFSNLDTDMDGRIKVNELITAFRDLGVAISRQEAAQLLKRSVLDDFSRVNLVVWDLFGRHTPLTSIKHLG